MTKKLVVVDSNNPNPEKEMSDKEKRRRCRPIKVLTIYKQGPYEIEMTSPRSDDDKEPVIFHCVAPYLFPLSFTAQSPEGQAFAQAGRSFGIDVVPVDPENRNSRIGIRGRIEWDIESPVIGTIEAAFSKMHDEMMDRIGEDVNMRLKYLQQMTHVPLSLPTERDIAAFGNKM